MSEDKSDPILKGNPVSLLVLNINSYAGGTNDQWGKSKKTGIKVENKKEKISFNKQNFGDGML